MGDFEKLVLLLGKSELMVLLPGKSWRFFNLDVLDEKERNFGAFAGEELAVPQSWCFH